MRRWRLDRELAAGASPDTGAAMVLRAVGLIGRGSQLRLSREIDELLGEAERPWHRLDWNLTDPRVVASDVRMLLQAVADRLLCGTPGRATSVAPTLVLLRDGTGPLDDPRRTAELMSSLTAALNGLEPGPG